MFRERREGKKILDALKYQLNEKTPLSPDIGPYDFNNTPIDLSPPGFPHRADFDYDCNYAHDPPEFDSSKIQPPTRDQLNELSKNSVVKKPFTATGILAGSTAGTSVGFILGQLLKPIVPDIPIESAVEPLFQYAHPLIESLSYSFDQIPYVDMIQPYIPNIQKPDIPDITLPNWIVSMTVGWGGYEGIRRGNYIGDKIGHIPAYAWHASRLTIKNTTINGFLKLRHWWKYRD